MASNPVTLAEFALTTKDKVLEKIAKNLVRESKAIGTVPWVSMDVMSVVNKKWQTLPAGGTRNINEGFSQVKGSTKDESWEPRFYGLDVQIDVQLENVQNAIESETSLQTKMSLAGLSRDWTYDFAVNTPVVNPKGMYGLQYLVSNYQNSRQQVWIDSNAANTGTALDVTASTANTQKFINALHKAMKYVGKDHPGKLYAYLNESMYLGVSVALRASGLLDTTTDAFGRQFTTFAGMPLIDLGTKSDQVTECVGITEGTGGASTSIYIVRWDSSDGAIGVQKGQMKVYDPLKGAEMESVPAHLLRIDWGCMIIPRSDYCIARVGGIQNPAAWTVPA
mgnify:CR=1 FL=1